MLLTEEPPSVDTLLDIPWIDIKDHGIHSCQLREHNARGELIDVGLEVECAWSANGGLRGRRVASLS